ncbi:hypothetical protein [Thiothrix fructosivorans]|uniref:Uncharacterized protein n=1 Tax=Thiothrix fructosivorans TaxID=111770 RepID=A0A8B0SGZ3_9GAMM|nr:hypothetical protein [Thiothrix fructosivorans]MBO0611714.1 hypothetical protein [Thiothrix fructosivorans]QTX10626.1 hypothetical protein J1836_019010 [Thiothrix fructosivorans]
MSDTSALYEEAAQGSYAQSILTNPAWKAACAQWEDDLTRQLRTLASDPTACQQIAFLLLAGDKFRQYLETVAQTGQMATIQLDQLSGNV